MGEANTIHELQNYVIGPARDGLVLAADGSLDTEHSFQKIDYFPRLAALSVKNNVQADVGSHPVDFIAVRISKAAVEQDEDAVWLYATEDRQVIILSRHDASGNLELRYLPVRGLQQDATGKIHMDTAELVAGLPLRLFEDPELAATEGERSAWLRSWHSELDWLHAVHKTKYSDGILALHEQFLREACAPDPGGDSYLLRRFQARRRRLAEPDLLIFANNHWNFNVRGFNPGRQSWVPAAHLHPFGIDAGGRIGKRDSTRADDRRTLRQPELRADHPRAHGLSSRSAAVTRQTHP